MHCRSSCECHAGDHIRGIPVAGASIVRENHAVGSAAQIRHVHTVCPGFRAPVIRGEPGHGDARPRCVGGCGCGTIILVDVCVDGVPPRRLGRVHHARASRLPGTACAGAASRTARLIEGTDRVGFRRTSGDLAAGNGDGAAVDLVGVGAIVKGGVRAGEVDVAAHVGDHHTIIVGLAVLSVTLNHEAGVLALAVAQVLAVAVHLVAEVVDRHHGLVLPHVVTGITQLRLLGKLCVIAAGADRTVEVQRGAAGTGTDDGPAHAQLVIVEIGGFLVAVRIIIMRFNPSDQLIVLRAAVTQARQVAGIQAAAADGCTHGLAVIGGGGAAAIGGVPGEHVGVARIVQAVVALEHLAVLVLGAVLQNGLPIHGMLRELVRKLDVLGRIEAETIHAVIDCFDEEVLHLVGGGLVLRVDIPQAEQMAVRHLPTVAVVDLVAVLARAVGTRVEQAGVLPVTADRVPIGREVVGDHVNDDTHAVLVGFSAHILQVLLGSHHEIADGRIRRLVNVIPVLSELLTVGQIRLDGAHRLGLHRRVAGLGNRLHIVLDGVERPHPCVEDSTVLHVLGQTVLGTCGLEVRVTQRVRVAVSLGISVCRSGGRHVDDATGDQHGRRCNKGHEFMAPLPRYFGVSRHIRSFRELSPEYRNPAAVHKRCAVQRESL